MHILPELTPPEYVEAAHGHWQAARNTAMHHCIRMQLAALASSRSRPGHAECHLISDLFNGGLSSAATPPSHDSANLLINSRTIQQPSGPSHDTPQSNKPPLLPAAYMHILVKHPPPKYEQTLGWVRDHHITRQHHQSLTCVAVDTHGRCCRSCHSGVLACSQHRHGSGHRHEPLRLAMLH